MKGPFLHVLVDSEIFSWKENKIRIAYWIVRLRLFPPWSLECWSSFLSLRPRRKLPKEQGLGPGVPRALSHLASQLRQNDNKWLFKEHMKYEWWRLTAGSRIRSKASKLSLTFLERWKDILEIVCNLKYPRKEGRKMETEKIKGMSLEMLSLQWLCKVTKQHWTLQEDGGRETGGKLPQAGGSAQWSRDWVRNVFIFPLTILPSPFCRLPSTATFTHHRQVVAVLGMIPIQAGTSKRGQGGDC